MCDDDPDLHVDLHQIETEDDRELSEDASNPPQDKACQFPELHNRRFSYESLQERRKRELRSEILNKINDFVQTYTSLGEAGTRIIMRDIIQSKKFQSEYKDLFAKPSGTGNDDKFLKSLAKDYKESKDREKSKLIRAQRAKVSQKLLIGRSMKDSKLEVNGAEVQGKKSRTEVAKVIGRVNTYGDE